MAVAAAPWWTMPGLQSVAAHATRSFAMRIGTLVRTVAGQEIVPCSSAGAIMMRELMRPHSAFFE
ncbi:hypothetical protein TKWG_06725 [Advenella kashmirensis WT001]|uniref:Uncharacterized protein n=1 Tax=Advenella kashmirensis (strain DSM 17095 / LMG 22695 / WT001) TaxID=1036672 RepID=I3U9U6_ADVKW|nr:hypothetical protein TKWG_06725 [Advenella kashmirensis WT001]